MSKFNTTKNKLSKLWNDYVANQNEIEQKSNLDAFGFFNSLSKDQTFKSPIELYASGDINITPSLVNNSVKTARKGSPLPTEVSYSQNIDLEIPEVFLPFIKYSVETDLVPETEAHGFYLYDTSDYVDDSMEVRGDGALVYKIDRLPTAGTIGNALGASTSTLASILALGISADLTKLVWKINASLVAGGTISQNIRRITAVISSAPSPNNENFTVDLEANTNHRIISITTSGFTAIGDYILGENLTQNVQKSYSWGTLESYFFFFSIPGDQILLDSEISSLDSFVTNNYWLYWSSLRQKFFVANVGGDQGDFKEITVSNFPDTDDGDSLPYTSITVKRNLIDPPSEIETYFDVNDRLLDVSANREFKNYFRISDTTATIPTHRFTFEGGFVVVAPARVENPDTTDFPVYNDIYTVVGTTYDGTSIAHSLLEKTTYHPETQDIIVNIKAYLVNPLYWREQRMYQK